MTDEEVLTAIGRCETLLAEVAVLLGQIKEARDTNGKAVCPACRAVVALRPDGKLVPHLRTTVHTGSVLFSCAPAWDDAALAEWYYRTAKPEGDATLAEIRTAEATAEQEAQS
jgi:hypothetical protein